MGSREGACASVLLMIGRLSQHHPWEHLTVHGAQECPARTSRRVGHVNMRVGSIARDHRRALDHRVRHLRVEIQSHRNRDVRRDATNAGKQLPFSIIVGFGHHRTMQRQQDCVATLLDLVRDGG